MKGWRKSLAVTSVLAMLAVAAITAGLASAHGSSAPGQEVEDLAIPARIRSGDLSVSTASQHIGPARVTIEAGQYHVTVRDRRAGVDVRLVPEAGFYLPPGEVDESAIISGYVVPVVRGWMTGTVRTARTSLDLVRVPAYHDHNWGTWQGVTWEWGEASGPDGAVLYGALHTSREKGVEAAGRPPVLFLWASPAAHRGGFEGIFPVRSVTYTRWHPGPRLAGRTIPAPGEVTIAAGDEPDAVRVRVRIRDALASPAPVQAAAGARPAQVFLQLRGDAEVRGTVDGRPFAWTGPAASETFVPFPP